MNCLATARALDRDQMILDHLPQVEMIAQSIHRRCPPSVLLEDLVSAGTLGLLDAMTRFDPNRHLKLKTLAEHRIRGAILDYLRRLDPLSRSVRQFERRRVAVAAEFESRCGRTPSDEELARELGLSLPKFCRLGPCGAGRLCGEPRFVLPGTSHVGG